MRGLYNILCLTCMAVVFSFLTDVRSRVRKTDGCKWFVENMLHTVELVKVMECS